jgi:amidase
LAEAALAAMKSLGAELVEVQLDPDFVEQYLDNWLRTLEAPLMYGYKEDWEAYLETLGLGVPQTVEEWVRIYETEVANSPIPPAAGGFAAMNELRTALMHSSDDPAYRDVMQNVLPQLTRLKLALFEGHGVDALVFPYTSTFAPPISNPIETVEDPTFMPAPPGQPSPAHFGGYSSVGFPMIVVPMGFGTVGLPAGITFMGRPYAEGRILGYAFDYEQQTRKRRPSPLVPPL